MWVCGGVSGFGKRAYGDGDFYETKPKRRRNGVFCETNVACRGPAPPRMKEAE
jgi:hypothetical protein